MEDERRREIGLFRYALIREAADARLSSGERGRLVRELALREHRGPDGRVVRVSRTTIDRWIRAWRREGFDGLVPKLRAGSPLSDEQLLELAVRLKREHPRRAATHICELIATELAARDDARRVPSPRTIQRHFVRLGLNRHPGPARKSFGRFEAAHRNDRWIGDGLHGPSVAGRRAILLAFVDDHSRLVVGHHWGRAEDTVRLEAALRRGLAARGVPDQIYVDRGSAFVSEPLHRACAVLGIKLSHSRPGEPEGRGKIERFFRTVRSQFLVEIHPVGVATFDLDHKLVADGAKKPFDLAPAFRLSGQSGIKLRCRGPSAGTVVGGQPAQDLLVAADLAGDGFERGAQVVDVAGEAGQRVRFAASGAMLFDHSTQLWAAVEGGTANVGVFGNGVEGDGLAGLGELEAGGFDAGEAVVIGHDA